MQQGKETFQINTHTHIHTHKRANIQGLSYRKFIYTLLRVWAISKMSIWCLRIGWVNEDHQDIYMTRKETIYRQIVPHSGEIEPIQEVCPTDISRSPLVQRNDLYSDTTQGVAHVFRYKM